MTAVNFCKYGHPANLDRGQCNASRPLPIMQLSRGANRMPYYQSQNYNYLETVHEQSTRRGLAKRLTFGVGRDKA
eukprot:gene40344-49894_t